MNAWLNKLWITITSYIPFTSIGLSIAISISLFTICFIVYEYIYKRHAKKASEFDLARFLSLSFLVGWLFFILNATLLSRISSMGTNYGINLVPFTINPDGLMTTVVTALYNVLMFIPLSFLMPKTSPLLKRSYITLPLCLLLAASVEIAQYYFRLGICELDDFLHYILGIIIGFCLSKAHRNKPYTFEKND